MFAFISCFVWKLVFPLRLNLVSKGCMRFLFARVISERFLAASSLSLSPDLGQIFSSAPRMRNACGLWALSMPTCRTQRRNKTLITRTANCRCKCGFPAADIRQGNSPFYNFYCSILWPTLVYVLNIFSQWIVIFFFLLLFLKQRKIIVNVEHTGIEKNRPSWMETKVKNIKFEYSFFNEAVC